MYVKVRKSEIVELNKVLDEAHAALKDLMTRIDRLEIEKQSMTTEIGFLRKTVENLSRVPNMPIVPQHGNLFNQPSWPAEDKYID